MKNVLLLTALLSIVISFQAKAAAFAGSYLSTTVGYGTIYTSEQKGVLKMYEDGQEFLMNGEMTLILEETVRNIQAINPELSEYEIVEELMTHAGTILGH